MVCVAYSWCAHCHGVSGVIVVCPSSWCAWRARGLLVLMVCVWFARAQWHDRGLLVLRVRAWRVRGLLALVVCVVRL